jgi:exodeoxyribonuclease V beta subunit
VRALFDLVAGEGDPVFGSYFERLATSALSGSHLAGLMTGSIDVAFRVPGKDAQHSRFVVADYKSNRLHTPGAPVPAGAYGRDAMRDGMEHGGYPLQALLYLVAMHRFLALRLPGYDIDTHLGPALYLFVRPMTGATTPVIDACRLGVFDWRPSSDLIIGVSRFLGGVA